jgi:dTDP-4-amino-4,6-dideoxygalactose transaminase
MAEVRAAIDRVLATHRYIGGPEVEALELELASYCGSAYAVGVSSGTDALVVSLLALGLEPGDEVVTTPFTFFATGGSVWRRCGVLRFVDIEPDSFNLDVSKLEAALTPKTKVVLPVHLFGRCVDVPAIRELIGDRPIRVLEDCAQAIGAEHLDQRAGAMGDLGAFSFFPSKNLGGVGDGGLVTTDDDELARRVRMLRNHGEGQQYHHHMVGGNFRLDAMNAAVLRAKLPSLDGWTEGRRKNAERYRALFADAGLLERGVVLPEDPDPEAGHRHIYNQFVCRFPRRDEVKAALQQAGIGCAVYYPMPLHLQECFADLGYVAGDFPEAERASREVLALPIFPELSDAQAEEIVDVIKGVLA